MKRLLLLLPLWALAGCKDPQDGVKVTVTYGQFVPGCVRVTATDKASGDTRSTDVAVREKKPAPNSQIVVGVLLPETWGPDITVDAYGYEAVPQDGTCVGTYVTNHQQGLNVPKGSTKDGKPAELTLKAEAADVDGDGYVSDKSGGSDCDDSRGSAFPGAPKRCDVVDNDCNDVPDAQELGINATCTGQTGCPGTVVCNMATGAAVCNSLDPLMAWADEDGDKHGDKNLQAIAVCAATLPTNRIPTSAPHDDCDDSRSNVNPQAAEICDGLDNNCDGPSDNLPPQDCTTPDSQCAGLVACANTSGGTKCEPKNPVPTWHADEDGDTQGSSTVFVATCLAPPAGYIQDGRDCDDGNPFRYMGAAELCDEQDNDCDTIVDNPELPVCAAAPQWATQKVGLTNPEQIWNGVSVFGNGGVWIVGDNSARAVKKPGVMAFDFHSDKCTDGTSPQRLLSVWAHPTTGDAYIGRDSGQLIYQTQDSTTCTPRTSVTPGDTDVTGLMGFADAGGVKVFGAGVKGDLAHGRTLVWDGGTASVSAPQVNGTPLYAIHGTSEALLFAVGAKNGKSAILRYKPTPTPASWADETGVPDIGVLRAVHVVNGKLAYAVSNDSKVLKWDGTGWSIVTGVPVPTGTPKAFSGVWAFGSNSIYITAEDGSLLRFNGNNWSVSPLGGGSLYGIAGTRPDDLWLVGRFSNVFHYPAAPQ
ncbi:hypothetical protein KH5H1_22790 [Corallococcus caeni]|uniref:putative metal-binding motif-containing protein n=1 Tax=Corallococcus caeni TaxID=3082388 RepID=UPI0029575235|nr:hypothetical protein KH5H1_22790 [Corallococcus sp. KH5-1]